MGDLGKRLARGEAAAFAELYDLCADRLHHYLVSQLGSRDDDHDVREAAEELTMALAGLRPEQREVVELKCYGGLTLAEIADVTAPPKRCKPRWERALELATAASLAIGIGMNLWQSRPDAAKADARTSWERYPQLLRDLAATTATFKL